MTPKPSGVNYINLRQNTNEWHEYRKHKITAGRLPYLLGILGKHNFILYWDVIKNGTSTPDLGHLKKYKKRYII